jgi:DNA helicase-2/ATP-dependent DNA helicase PcrA
VETARIAAARRRGVALHEIAVHCTTNELCRRAVEALRQAGVPAYFRNTDDYRLTPCTALVEGCVAWACRGRETSNYRLGSLLRQWRSIRGTGHIREQDAASPEPSAGEEFQPTAAAASSSAAPASARKVHVVLGFQSGHQRILSDIGNGLEEGQRAPH